MTAVTLFLAATLSSSAAPQSDFLAAGCHRSQAPQEKMHARSYTKLVCTHADVLDEMRQIIEGAL